MSIYSVAIGYAGKATSIETIQQVLANAGWARYAPNCWIVDTHESPYALSQRLRAVVSTQDSILVCELNLQNNSGFLQKEIWDWINERKLRR